MVSDRPLEIYDAKYAKCRLTGKLMEHPVQCCGDDRNYERDAYIQHLDEHDNNCPCKNKKIDRSGPGWKPKRSGNIVLKACKKARLQDKKQMVDDLSEDSVYISD
jgi:hypothetical protein